MCVCDKRELERERERERVKKCVWVRVVCVMVCVCSCTDVMIIAKTETTIYQNQRLRCLRLKPEYIFLSVCPFVHDSPVSLILLSLKKFAFCVSTMLIIFFSSICSLNTEMFCLFQHFSFWTRQVFLLSLILCTTFSFFVLFSV